MDGWANLLGGFGVKGRDASLSDQITEPVILSDLELEWLYRGDAIAARAVDVLPDDAIRQGWDLQIDSMSDGNELDPQESKKAVESVAEYHKRIKTRVLLRRGLTVSRIFGAALMVIGVDDVQGAGGLDHFSKPVREDSIKSVRWLQVVGRQQCSIGDIETDPSSEFFGMPAWYEINGLAGGTESVRVHASRVVRLEAAFNPETLWGQSADTWPDAVLTRLYVPLSRFEFAYASAAKTVRDLSRAVYKIKNLHNMIVSNKEEVVRRRLEIAELSASVLNAYLIDSVGEDFGFVARSTTGLPEILDRLGVHLSAASGMPITLLLGLSPGGFGTGEDEDRRWSNTTQAFRQDHCLPGLELLTRYILLAKDGPTKGALPDKYSVTFPALRQPTDKEVAEIRKLHAETMATLVTSNILLEDEVAEGTYGGAEWSMDIALDRQLRKELELSARAGQQSEEHGDPDLDDKLRGARDPEDGPGDRKLALVGDQAMRVVQRVHDGALSVAAGSTFLARVFGFPIEDAEAVCNAAAEAA